MNSQPHPILGLNIPSSIMRFYFDKPHSPLYLINLRKTLRPHIIQPYSPTSLPLQLSKVEWGDNKKQTAWNFAICKLPK